jgi:hypothetical protein
VSGALSAPNHTRQRCKQEFSKEVFTDGCSKETGQESRQVHPQGRQEACQKDREKGRCQEGADTRAKGEGTGQGEGTGRKRQERQVFSQSEGRQAFESRADEDSSRCERQSARKGGETCCTGEGGAGWQAARW